MPESVLSNPVVVRLLGALAFLSICIVGNNHRRITTIDKKREELCMSKEQCVTNRDYQNRLLDKISEGQDRVEKAVVAVHSRVDEMCKKTMERRGGD